MVFIGIDPGLHGGLALLTENFPPKTWPMPLDKEGKVDEQALEFLLDGIAQGGGIIHLEKAWPRPSGGACSSFSMGNNFGYLRCLCDSTGCDVWIVSPQKWKKFYWADRVIPDDITPSQRVKLQKRDSLLKVKQLYGLTFKMKDEGQAEALLIAHYGKKQAQLQYH